MTTHPNIRPTPMPRTLHLLAMAATTLLIPAAHAQAVPTYDVASIKINKSLNGNMMWKTAPNSFSATNLTLHQLLVSAYGIRDGLIFGLPGWADNTHFDLDAKIVDPDLPALKKLTNEQRRQMLATLLAERFHLKVHNETKTLQVYDLVVAKDGPKFQPITPLHLTPPDDTPAKLDLDPKAKTPRGGWSSSDRDFQGSAVPIESLATFLSDRLDHTVIDKTALPAQYDIHLKWTPDDASAKPDNGLAADAPPPLFTAIQEQLGLKLIPAKGPVVTLVVDHVELPTEN